MTVEGDTEREWEILDDGEKKVVYGLSLGVFKRAEEKVGAAFDVRIEGLGRFPKVKEIRAFELAGYCFLDLSCYAKPLTSVSCFNCILRQVLLRERSD